MELALEWLESQRAVMYDPTKADWFLQYTDGHGNKNGTIYSEPNEWGDQFFWDYPGSSVKCTLLKCTLHLPRTAVFGSAFGARGAACLAVAQVLRANLDNLGELRGCLRLFDAHR